jgi:alkaline phosphatase
LSPEEKIVMSESVRRSFVRLLIPTAAVLLLAALLLPGRASSAPQSKALLAAAPWRLTSPTAQDSTGVPVLILPVDKATFLPGSKFDFRVEVHAEALPEDFAVTVDGVPAAEYFGAEPTEETWTFGDEAAPTTSQSIIWRQLTAPAPGEYLVQVTADGGTKEARWFVVEPQDMGAKNVILFIADGMTQSMVTAARVASRGQVEGKYNSYFTMDQMEEIGFVNTSSLDSIMTDSANSASTYNTGHKGAVNSLGVYPDTSPDTLDDPRVETLAEMLRRSQGKEIGIVTTSDWTDATPAAVFGHTRRRADRAFLAAAPLDEGLLPEVIMGGGARYMLPQSVEGSARKDDRDMFAEYEAAGYTIVTNRAEMQDALAADTPPDKVLGIFHSSDMNVWLDRNQYTDNTGDFPDQPNLDEMTLAALEVIGDAENGFYLEVEAASVDKQAHPMDMHRMLADLIEFDNAVAAAMAWAAENAPDTLIVVTADHGHGFDVFGTVDTEAFNAATSTEEKRNAVRIYDDAGFPTYVDEDGDFQPDTWDVAIGLAGGMNNFPGHREDFQVGETPRVPAIQNDAGNFVANPDEVGIPISGNLPIGSTSGVHTLQDVAIFASGPGAEYFGRVMDNSEVFLGLAYALGLDPAREPGSADACAGFYFNGRCYTR